MIKLLSTSVLKLMGWKTKGQLPSEKKMILIGAYHTSNWDFVLSILALGSLGVRFNWVGKHTLFQWPLGILFKKIGGIPVNRSSATSFLRSVIELFHKREQLILAMSPEGTRSYTKKWKTGFYTLAVKAGVPVVMCYVDYPSKTIGIGDMFVPTGEVAKDMQLVVEFYKDVQGKFPEKQSDILQAQ